MNGATTGAMTLGKMALIIAAISIAVKTQINIDVLLRVTFLIVMLNVVKLNVIKLCIAAAFLTST